MLTSISMPCPSWSAAPPFKVRLLTLFQPWAAPAEGEWGRGVMNNDPSAHRGHGRRWRRTELQRFAITTRLSSPSVLRLSHLSFSRKGRRELCVFRCYLLSLLNDPLSPPPTLAPPPPLYLSPSCSFTFTVQCTFLFPFLENSPKRGGKLGH